MIKLGKYIFGCALLTSGLLITDAQAFTGLGSIDSAQGTVGNGLIIFVHSCHDNCQPDPQGRSHWHKGMKCKKVSCPGGKKYSPDRPSLDCPTGACLGTPDGSLINHSPLPSSDKAHQQSH